MSEQVIAEVLDIALRTGVGGPMRRVAEAVAVENAGLQGDVPSTQGRGITFISSEQWAEVVGELGRELPWHTRRANVLLRAVGLSDWIGRCILLGEVEVEITLESKPCKLMDRLAPGLRDALSPDCRGGVAGRVVKGGIIRVGDTARVAS